MSLLAQHMAAVKPSPSMAVSQAAKAQRAQGVDVIDLDKANSLSPFSRISTATSDVVLSEAIARIGMVVARLQ